MTSCLEERAMACTAPTPDIGTGFTAPPHGSMALPSGYLSFRLGREEYGIDILRVQEIRSYEAPTRIVNAPHFVKGMVNLRGVIVPIVDLRLKLGCETAECNGSTVIIVLCIRGRVIGALVDSVSDVLALGAHSIKPAPQMTSLIDPGCVMGIGCVHSSERDRMLILTDIEALLSSADIGLFEGAPHEWAMPGPWAGVGAGMDVSADWNCPVQGC